MLTPKQARFVEEYLVDLNGTQAAIRAGYAAGSADVTGCRLLANAKIMSAVESAKSKRSAKTELTAEWVLRRLQEEAEERGDGASHGARVSALKLLAQHVGACIERKEIDAKLDGRVRIEIVEEIVTRDSTEVNADRHQDDPAPPDPA